MAPTGEETSRITGRTTANRGATTSLGPSASPPGRRRPPGTRWTPTIRILSHRRHGDTPALRSGPLFGYRRVTGATRAIPRRIQGVRLAITATARSERRIAVRGPGVGVDASCASGDP